MRTTNVNSERGMKIASGMFERRLQLGNGAQVREVANGVVFEVRRMV